MNMNMNPVYWEAVERIRQQRLMVGKVAAIATHSDVERNLAANRSRRKTGRKPAASPEVMRERTNAWKAGVLFWAGARRIGTVPATHQEKVATQVSYKKSCIKKRSLKKGFNAALQYAGLSPVLM